MTWISHRRESDRGLLIGVLTLMLLAGCGGGGMDCATAAPPLAECDGDHTFGAIRRRRGPRLALGHEVRCRRQATLPLASGEQAISVAKAGFAEQVKLVALLAGRSSDTRS
jgi:hypothetical protein